MARKDSKGRGQGENPTAIDPETGELYDPKQRRKGRGGSGALDALKGAAREAIVRRTSTKP